MRIEKGEEIVRGHSWILIGASSRRLAVGFGCFFGLAFDLVADRLCVYFSGFFARISCTVGKSGFRPCVEDRFVLFALLFQHRLFWHPKPCVDR